MTPDDAIPGPLTDETSRTVFRDRGEIIAALTARNAELEAVLAEVVALADEWSSDAEMREFNLDSEAGIRWTPRGYFARNLRSALASAGRPATSDGRGWVRPTCPGCDFCRPASPVVAFSATDEDRCRHENCLSNKGWPGFHYPATDDVTGEAPK